MTTLDIYTRNIASIVVDKEIYTLGDDFFIADDIYADTAFFVMFDGSMASNGGCPQFLIAANDLGDAYACFLAEVMIRFPLSDTEIAEIGEGVEYVDGTGIAVDARQVDGYAVHPTSINLKF